ncbi:hypothetical protein GCM10010172_56340 [Paractinoplanes ferrugineus]|uniref:WxL domain-containing protein n=1 Tax=Paractinoplanes ferrugineus TaxID=113564 RepID=A0A919IYQ4_9ACTN|nr:hypothetical protein [Actinoplanes ferrugineus]GIE10895.1 hypothetical protein Afe05nite_27350 [Actinoplanes ferrugineus]
MFRNWTSRLAALATLSTGAALAVAAPAYAAALTSVSWSLSNPQPSTSSVRYTWSFTTATTGIIQSVTFSVPAGTGGTPSVVDVYGLTGGTAALSGTTVTYTVTTPSSVAGGTSVLVSLDGFTNTGTPGTYASTVTTVVGGSSSDTATSSTVAINSNTTAVTVVVARSTAFTSDTTSFTMLMDPSVAALSDETRAVHLGIATNATNGYVLNVKTSQHLTGAVHPGSHITAATPDRTTGLAPAAFAPGMFGYTLTTTGLGTGTSSPLTSGNYVGYVTGAGDNVVSASGPTNGDAVTITNRAKIDYTQPADDYSATVTYTVVPSY